jgi:hypothetical protein
MKTFLEQRCQLCHTDPPKFGAPMPLVDLESLAAPAVSDPSVSVGQLLPVRMKDKKKPMPQPPSSPATADEVAMVEAWLASGSPAADASTACGQAGSGQAGQAGQAGAGQAGEGQGGAGQAGDGQGGAGQAGEGQGGAGASGGQAGQAGQTGGASGAGQGGGGQGGGMTMPCTPDITVAPTSPWEMPQDSDDQYACYGFDVPASDVKRQITTIAPKIDNDTIVHHLLVMLADESQPSAPTPCSALLPSQWKLLYAWGPGTPAHQLPPEAGFPIEKGETAHVVMQVHYSNLTHKAGQSDKSGIQLCSTTELRPNDADVMALGSISFNIPAHAKKTIDCETITSPLAAALPITVFQAWPHMHLLGSAISSKVVHPDGTETPLGGTESYSFYNQITYPVNTVVGPKDRLFTSCSWENTGNSSVSFGEETQSEMCFNFLSYYPKINSSQWNWLVPASLLAQCK